MSHPSASTLERTHAVRFDLDTPALAATYDRVGVRQFEHGKLLIAALDPKPGERVLDIGTGTGLLAVYTAQRVAPGGRVVGIDPLPARIAIAAAKNQSNFETRAGRAEDLSAFTDNSFDVVYLNSVFHWVEDKALALAEIFRVLRPGGRLGLNSGDAERPHQSATLLRRASEAAGLPEASRPHGRNLGAVSNTQLRDLLRDAGFTQIDSATRTIVDQVSDAHDIYEWSRSSSFGNAVADLDDAAQQRLFTALEAELQPYRRDDGDGYRLERYLVFASARKPAAA